MCDERRRTDIEAQISALRIEVAEARGRLANAPSTFQILSWLAGIAIGLVGLIFTAARLI